MDISSSVAHIPDHIIELILSKCPIKSLLRFESVSKSWQSIISDPRFSRKHRIERSKLLENQRAFFIRDSDFHVMRLEEEEEDEKFRAKSDESLELGYPACCGELFRALCSSNGLILIVTYKKEYMLWNPLTRKHIIIPALHPRSHRKAFKMWTAPKTHPHPHPDPRPHLYHDSLTDDYRIVFHYDGLGCYAVYSCRNGSWGEIKDFPDLDWEECLYGVEGSCLYGLREDNTEIVSFDARDGTVNDFPLPEGVYGLVNVKVEAVSGRLWLYGFNQAQRTRLHLWVMEENGSLGKSWRKLISMEKELTGIRWMRPIYLTNKDDVVIRAEATTLQDVLFISIRDEEAEYNPHENCKFKEIDYDNSRWPPNFRCAYVENLEMPTSSNADPSVLHKCRKRRFHER